VPKTLSDYLIVAGVLLIALGAMALIFFTEEKREVESVSGTTTKTDYSLADDRANRILNKLDQIELRIRSRETCVPMRAPVERTIP